MFPAWRGRVRITGVTAIQSELPGKRLALLKELLPGARKVAVFANDQTAGQLAAAQDAARRLGLALHVVDFKRPPFDYEAGFTDAVGANADALFVLASGLWVPARRKITELALKARLPTVFHQSQWAEAGGLMSYGFNFPGMWRRGARHGGEDSARLEGGRHSDGTADCLRTGDQHENCQGARHQDPVVDAAACRPGDRVVVRNRGNCATAASVHSGSSRTHPYALSKPTPITI